MSRTGNAEETFDDISEYVSLMVGRSRTLLEMCKRLPKPDVNIPVSARKADLPSCPVISLYGLSCLYLAQYITFQLCFVFYCIDITKTKPWPQKSGCTAHNYH